MRFLIASLPRDEDLFVDVAYDYFGVQLMALPI